MFIGTSSENPLSEGNLETATVGIESSSEDLEEVSEVEDFIQICSECTLGPQKFPSSNLFSKAVISDNRNNCAQLSSNQFDLAVLGQLHALRTNKDCIPTSYKGNRDNFRPFTTLMFRGKKISQSMFLFFHKISIQKLVTLCHHVDEKCIVERTHGNVKGLPSNACSLAQLNEICKLMTT